MSLVIPLGHCAVVIAAALLLILAALRDAHQYRIPNLISLALIALFPIYVITTPHGIDWQQHVMVCGLVLMAGLAMFFRQLAGAGDIKLLTAAALWAGPHYIAVFLITTAMAGGALALIMAGLTHLRNRSRKPLPIAHAPIPYGVAIAAGGLNVLYHLAAAIIVPG